MSERKNNPADEELVITRLFDSLRSLVWKAWTEPEIAKPSSPNVLFGDPGSNTGWIRA
jgi:hypothetical protein